MEQMVAAVNFEGNIFYKQWMHCKNKSSIHRILEIDKLNKKKKSIERNE